MYTINSPNLGPIGHENGTSFAKTCRFYQAASIGLIDPVGTNYSDSESPSMKILNNLMKSLPETDRDFFNKTSRFSDEASFLS